MDAATLEAFVQVIRHQRLVMDHLYLSASAFLVYDYILMIPLEIRLIWPSPWSYTKILYLFVRYTPFASIGLVLYNQLAPNADEGTCRVTWPAAAWSYVAEVILAETILAIRTWATWRRDQKVGTGLAFLMLGNMIFQCVFANRFVKSFIYGPRPYAGYRGCWVDKASRILWVNYVVLTIVETAVLALMAISGVRAYRSGHRNKLADVIHKDGILFYVYLLCFTIANVFAICLLPPEYMNMLAPFEDALYSTLTSRIIINIRNVPRGDSADVATELHEWSTRPTIQTLTAEEFQTYRAGVWSQSSGRRNVIVEDH